MKIFKFLIFISLFSPFLAIAQIGIDRTEVPKSPNAAAFDKIDPIPVELATGGTNISFTMYEVKTKSFDMPITLQYHSGGIQVDESPSWLGLGWALDIGGSVTRSIQGSPDEGIYLQKGKKYFLYSSTVGPINSFANSNSPFNYDTSRTAVLYFQKYYNDRGINYGTFSVRSEFTDPLYKKAVQSNLWGTYTSLYMFNGLTTYPPLYTDVLTANADYHKTGLLFAPSEYDERFVNGLVDALPDEFTLKIPGYSGKFFINTQGVPTLNPIDRDLKIEYLAKSNESDTDVAPFIDTWTVTSTDGKKYYFGNGDDSKSYSNGGYGTNSQLIDEPIVGWQLTKMVDINTGDSIIFKYKHIAASTDLPGGSFFMGNNPLKAQNVGLSLDRHLTYESIPTQVITANEVVNFYSSDHISSVHIPRNGYSDAIPSMNFSAGLDSIAVANKISADPIARYYFSYGYFKLNGKLKLNYFQKISNNLVDVLPPTYFSYYDTVAAVKLFHNSSAGSDSVGYTPLAQDYWGYYNNAQQNYMGFGVFPASFGIPGTRKPSWPWMQEGVLNKIIYPEGSQTIVSYEPHSASTLYNEHWQLATEMFGESPFNMDSIGGVRVKSIRQIDKDGKIAMVRNYSYKGEDGLSSGHLNLTPSVTQRIQEALCYNPSDSINFLFLSTKNTSPKHRNTATVNYARVTETMVDSAGNSNGYIIHSFNNDANLADSSYLTYTIHSPNGYNFNGLGNMPYWLAKRSLGKNLINGLEKETDVYDKTGKLLLKTTKEYAVKEPSSYVGFIGGFDLREFSLDNACGGLTSQPFVPPHSEPENSWVLVVIGDSVYRVQPPVNYHPRIMIEPLHKNYYIRYYAEYPKFLYLSKTTETKYTSLTGTRIVSHKSFYESPNHHSETKTIDYDSKGDSLTTIKLYAFDYGPTIGADTTCKQMQSLYFNPLIASTSFFGNQIQSGNVILYKNFGTSAKPSLFPDSIYVHHSATLNTPLNTYSTNGSVSYPVTHYFADNNYELEQTENFDVNGNLLEIQKKGSEKEAFIWGYNKQYPVAKIDGGDYLTASALVNQTVLNNIATTDAAMRTELNKIRTAMSKNLVSTYTYRPLVGLTSETNPAGETNYYQYDGYERLATVRDHQNNLLRKICYNYAGVPSNCSSGLFYNSQVSRTFTTNNCAPGFVGVTMDYVVAAYKYSGGTVAAAAAMAQTDINMNGQDFVNNSDQCRRIYYNRADTGVFYSNNCGEGALASPINYIVAANTDSSFTSQEDADRLAALDIEYNGQSYANEHGGCVSTSFDITIANINYPNDAFSHISVTLKNKSTGVTYSTGNITPPSKVFLSYLPGGLYTITYSGVTYSPNTAVGLVIGNNGGGTQVSCSSTSGLSQVVMDNVTLENGQQYYFSQISSCGEVPPVEIAAPIPPQKN